MCLGLTTSLIDFTLPFLLQLLLLLRPLLACQVMVVKHFFFFPLIPHIPFTLFLLNFPFLLFCFFPLSLSFISSQLGGTGRDGTVRQQSGKSEFYPYRGRGRCFVRRCVCFAASSLWCCPEPQKRRQRHHPPGRLPLLLLLFPKPKGLRRVLLGWWRMTTCFGT